MTHLYPVAGAGAGASGGEYPPIEVLLAQEIG